MKRVEREPPASLHGYDARAHSRSFQLVSPKDDVSLVEQQHKDEVDITTIVRRFGMTGVLPKGRTGGVYGDFTGISDYETAREALSRADASFMELDAEIRARFDNSPGQFLRWAEHDPEEFERRVQGPRKVDPPVAPSGVPDGGSGGGSPAGET